MEAGRPWPTESLRLTPTSRPKMSDWGMAWPVPPIRRSRLGPSQPGTVTVCQQSPAHNAASRGRPRPRRALAQRCQPRSRHFAARAERRRRGYIAPARAADRREGERVCCRRTAALEPGGHAASPYPSHDPARHPGLPTGRALAADPARGAHLRVPAVCPGTPAVLEPGLGTAPKVKSLCVSSEIRGYCRVMVICVCAITFSGICVRV